MASKVICSIPNCGKRHDAKSFCKSHYHRFKKHGDPFAGGEYRVPKGTLLKYIRDVVLVTKTDNCLPWPFGTMPNGYGSVKYKGTTRAANHVVCCELYGNPPTPAHHSAHLCGNKLCVNPRHLRWATPSENSLDRHEHGTMQRGETHPWAKLKDSEVIEIRKLKGIGPATPIARKYGVSPDIIRMIWRGETRQWL